MKIHRYRGRVLILLALMLAAVLAPIGVSPAQAAGITEAYFVAPDNTLRRVIGGTNVDTGFLVRGGGGGPAVVRHPGNGLVEAIFADGNGVLRSVGTHTGARLVAGGPGVKYYTKPAVASIGTKPVIAFHRSFDSHLVVVDESDRMMDTGFVVQAGTSPAITVEGPWRMVVFTNDADGHLWSFNWRETSSGRQTQRYKFGGGLGAAPASSPSIVAVTSTNTIGTFRANGTNTLFFVDRSGVGRAMRATVANGTDPVITRQRNGEPVIVFQNAGDNLLWSLKPETGVFKRLGNGLGIDHTSTPAIAPGVSENGFALVFNANQVNTFWTVDDAAGTQKNHGFIVRPGSTPGVAGK
ncbi:hypothetical protein [Kineosporia babensis]|uniref:Uncharacterized protein n=1 Tax=Kineosporia babensis TaxID=499548 RepID=A0A9X1SSB2_9ACTN|nr:hypothetical protein [Kineosporia babensis]MCD5310482.1 hypothetical protein [Kineosporia babensis]